MMQQSRHLDRDFPGDFMFMVSLGRRRDFLPGAAALQAPSGDGDVLVSNSGTFLALCDPCRGRVALGGLSWGVTR